MKIPVLHLLDASTTPDAMASLALLLARSQPEGAADHVAVLGHRRTGELAALAGIRENLTYLPSMGWADPTGWRAMRRLVEATDPGILHAWGISAVVAATAMTRWHGECLASFAHVPTAGQHKLLRLAAARRPWRFAASSSAILRSLHAAGIAPERSVRIRPGLALGSATSTGETSPGAVREALGIAPADGPVVLLGGEGPHARHDYGLWSIGIMSTLLPRIRVIVRDPARGVDWGFERLGENLASHELVVTAPYEMGWGQLLRAADMLLVTPDGPMETGSILHAMAASVPVIGTPVECVAELVEHGHTGLLAKELRPRAIAARIEEYMADSTLRWPLTDHARADVYEQFGVARMVQEYATWYRQGVLHHEGAAA